MTSDPKAVASPAAQIAGFLARFEPAIAKEARAGRRALRRWMPTAVEMVYDNYNALVFGFCPGERPSEAILSIAAYPRSVALCFLQGARLDDPDGLLRGSGNTSRHVVLERASDLQRPALRALIGQAIARAKVPLPSAGRGRTLVKSISAKQQPRRPRPRAGSR